MCTNHCSDIFGCTREDFKEYWGFKLKRLREESPDLFGSKYQVSDTPLIQYIFLKIQLGRLSFHIP